MGRHSIWLQQRGWQVTAVDREPGEMSATIEVIRFDFELNPFPIASNAWDLILCWLYWQADLLPPIRNGVRPGGIVAMCGKRTGRFATSLENYREAFPGWNEVSAGTDATLAWFIARRPLF